MFRYTLIKANYCVSQCFIWKAFYIPYWKNFHY